VGVFSVHTHCFLTWLEKMWYSDVDVCFLPSCVCVAFHDVLKSSVHMQSVNCRAAFHLIFQLSSSMGIYFLTLKLKIQPVKNRFEIEHCVTFRFCDLNTSVRQKTLILNNAGLF